MESGHSHPVGGREDFNCVPVASVGVSTCTIFIPAFSINTCKRASEAHRKSDPGELIIDKCDTFEVWLKVIQVVSNLLEE